VSRGGITLAVGVVTAAGVLAALLAGSPPWTLRMDNTRLYLGLVVESLRAWTHGAAPHWTDRVWGGFPMICDPTSAALYPPLHAAVWLAGTPPLRAFDVALATHLGLLAAGTFYLLGLLGAGLLASAFGTVLALSSPLLLWSGVTFFSVAGAQSWWPWTLVAAELLARPATARIGGAMVLGWTALAAQTFVGMPEQMAYASVLASAWLLTRRSEVSLAERALRSGLLVVGAAAVAAPQLLPTARYLHVTARADVVAFAGAVALDPAAPARLLFPGAPIVMGIPVFYGAATIALAALAVARRPPRAGFLVAAAGVGVLLALGDHTPVYGWLHRVPPFDRFRNPIKLEALPELALAWAAALGVQAAWTAATSRRRRVVVALAFLALGEHTLVVLQTTERFAAARRQEVDEARVLSTLADVARVVARDAPAAPPLVLDTWATVPVEGPRLFARNLTAVAGVSSVVGGDMPLMPRLQNELLTIQRFSPATLDVLGVGYVLVRAPDCAATQARLGWRITWSGGAACLLENPARPSRFALLGEARAVASESALGQAMRSEAPLPVAVLAPPSVIPPPLAAAPRDVAIESWSPGAVALRATTRSPALLLVRQSWAPGWDARVDGAPVETYRAAGPWFVVPVPAGAHAVTLRYRTPGFGAGCAFAAAWLALAGAWRVRYGAASLRADRRRCGGPRRS